MKGTGLIGTHDLQRIDRRIGWIMSLGGAGVVLGQAPVMLAARDDYPLWWHGGVGVLAGVVLFLGAAGWALRPGLLGVLWRITPALGALLMMTSFLGYTGSAQPDQVPWILSFDAVLTTYLMLWMSPWLAALGTVLTATLVPLSAWIFLGSVPQVVVAAMPVHMANIGFIALFAGVRAQMIATRSAARAAAEGRTREATARIEAEHREQVSRMLHDEVLSVLTAAIRTRGTPSPELRRMAGDALALLATPWVTPDSGTETCHEAATRLVREITAVDPSCRVEVSTFPGAVAISATEAILGAAREALRNSLLHAGATASRSLLVRAHDRSLTVVVHDDGCGFDPAQVSGSSLGISRSIIGRMGSLPGGTSQVASRPGGPTSVTLRWRA